MTPPRRFAIGTHGPERSRPFPTNPRFPFAISPHGASVGAHSICARAVRGGGNIPGGQGIRPHKLKINDWNASLFILTHRNALDLDERSLRQRGDLHAAARGEAAVEVGAVNFIHGAEIP